jgi:hypothetical protein
MHAFIHASKLTTNSKDENKLWIMIKTEEK